MHKASSSLLVFVSAAALFAADHTQPVAGASAGPSPDVALGWLKYGNERHVGAKYVHWHQTMDRRQEVAKGQKPHAIVVSCSDSRVPPEIVFDQGLGDLFVVRVAGHVVGEKELGSIEYAAEHLNAPLIVVMGHQRCGALQAAVGGGAAAGHIGSLIASLTQAVERSKPLPGDPLDNAIHTNVDTVVEQLRDSEPVLGHMVRSGKIKVVGAYYSLDTGKVEWLGEEGSRARMSALQH
ncbi:MAG: carbonic anhydrase [Bryobacteraceae bacterium]